MVHKISSLEYKLRQILSTYGDEDLTDGFSPRTLVEEEQDANNSLRVQLSTFKNTDGLPMDSDVVESLAGKPQ